MLASQGARWVYNDHIAMRSFVDGHNASGLKWLRAIFSHFGFVPQPQIVIPGMPVTRKKGKKKAPRHLLTLWVRTTTADCHPRDAGDKKKRQKKGKSGGRGEGGNVCVCDVWVQMGE